MYPFSKDTIKLAENDMIIDSFSQKIEKSYTFELHQNME